MKKVNELIRKEKFNSISSSCYIEGLNTSANKVKSIFNNELVETTAKEVFFVWNMKKAWDSGGGSGLL